MSQPKRQAAQKRRTASSTVRLENAAWLYSGMVRRQPLQDGHHAVNFFMGVIKRQ